MLELFFKHLEFVGIKPTDATYVKDDRRIVKFNDPALNKHWLSFYATYMNGRKSAFDDLGVWAVQNVSKVNV